MLGLLTMTKRRNAADNIDVTLFSQEIVRGKAQKLLETGVTYSGSRSIIVGPAD
jgi:hypothetical protein